MSIVAGRLGVLGTTKLGWSSIQGQVPGGSGMQIFWSGRFPDLLGQMAAVQGSVGAHGGLCPPSVPRCCSTVIAGAGCLVWGRTAWCGAGSQGNSLALMRGGWRIRLFLPHKATDEGVSAQNGCKELSKMPKEDGGGLSTTTLGLSPALHSPACTHSPVHQFCWVF